MLRDGICGAQGRAEACVCGLVGGEHGGQLVEQRDQRLLALGQVDQYIPRHGCEELVRLGHDQHLGGGAVEVVEMERGVVGQQSDLGALAAREAIERVAERRGHATQHARRNRLVGHVDEKEEDGRLRRTDHVFLRRYKLHCPAVQLRPLHLVAARPRLVQLADVVGRTVVCQRADVTPPAPAVVDERHKGVDVRPAPPTAHHARRPKIHNGHGRLSAAGQRGDDCAERKRHFGLGGG
mmetsp:Transcript_17175/g.56094  ORF Transcript_17175/g.56094 Transcript_17175/m.56094 type:complete len:238 (+) Transcript_17175:958-1671(+)